MEMSVVNGQSMTLKGIYMKRVCISPSPCLYVVVELLCVLEDCESRDKDEQFCAFKAP